MDSKILEEMQMIYDQKGNDQNTKKDISFIGTMVYTEESSDGKIPTIHDVFLMTFKDETGNTNKVFFNEDGKCLGGIGKDGQILPSSEFIEYDSDFLAQLEYLNQNDEITLESYENYLEKIAKEFGIDKENLRSFSEFDLDQEIEIKQQEEDKGKNKKEEDKDKISLKTDNEQPPEIQEEKNKEALENIDSKREINMDKLIDDRHSLADVLGLPSGCKLIAVYSDAIAGNKNTTTFSFIIQNPDGTLQPADMLEQTGGKDSDKTVYETNRDGSSVNLVNVKSSFKINSPIIENGILNVRYDQMEGIKVNFGQMSKTDPNKSFTQELKPDYFDATKKVKNVMGNREDGIHGPDNRIREAQEHTDAGCDRLTLDEADGKEETGHKHDESGEVEQNTIDRAIENIKNRDSSIEDVFTDREIEKRFHHMRDKHPDESFDQVIEDTARDLSEDASHLKSRGEHQ